jgi:tetratricopeptide (TPR) repeat protein
LDFSPSLLKDSDGLGRFDKLLITSLLSVDREKLIGNFASAEPALLQNDCALFDLQLRSGRRKAAEQALDRIMARPEIAQSQLPSNLIRFIIRHNLSKKINDTALAAKLYRKFPDPNLMELRDIVVYIGETEGDIEVIKLLRPLPYTECVARAVEWWRPGLRERDKVEAAAQRFQAAGRYDLAKAVKSEPVATVRESAGPTVSQTQNLKIAQVQGHAPPPSTDPNTAEYWLEKARAANRENDIKTAESALGRALEIASVESFGGSHSKGGTIRENVLAEYLLFLIKQNRPDEAMTMLRREIAGPGLNTYSGRYALKMLCQWELMTKKPAIKPGDEMLKRVVWIIWQAGRRNSLLQSPAQLPHCGHRPMPHWNAPKKWVKEPMSVENWWWRNSGSHIIVRNGPGRYIQRRCPK